MENGKEEQNDINWEKVARFIEATLPHAKPLIEEWIRFKTKTAEDQAEINRLSHQIASRQLGFEIAFIMAVLMFSGAIIWVFITNGAPDTAEKILFAVLGFVGGRGFFQLRRN